jgi:hypothetical protein
MRNSNLITFTSFSFSVNQTPNIHLLIPVFKVELISSVPKGPTWNVSPYITILVLLIFDKLFNKGYWKAGSCQIQLHAQVMLTVLFVSISDVSWGLHIAKAITNGRVRIYIVCIKNHTFP